MAEHYFNVLRKHDVSKHIEKKGQFNYLSWAYAVDELRRLKPEATWKVIKSVDGYPYTITPAGCFVEVEVTVDGISLSQIHPVLDNRNQTIEEPNAFQVNTSIQRCLAKAIALHGLGLYIFRGEDLPEPDPITGAQRKRMDELVKKVNDDKLSNMVNSRLKEGTIHAGNYEQTVEYITTKLNGVKDDSK